MAGVERFQDGLARASGDHDPVTVEHDEAVVDAEAIPHCLVLPSKLRRQTAASAPQRGQQRLVLRILLRVLVEELLVGSNGVEGGEGRPLVAVVLVGRGGEGRRVRLVAATGNIAAAY